MGWFFRRRRQLREAATFAEALAEGDTTTRILEEGHGAIAQLFRALYKISQLLEQRSSILQKEESHLSGLLATMSEGVLLTDPNGDIVVANQALRDLFQITTSPTGKSIIEAFRLGELQAACDELLVKPGRKSLEITLAFPQEKILRVNLSTMERRGRIQGVVGVFIDITQMRKLEELRKEFIANISHEIKTPLSSIKGYSETLKQGALKDSNKVGEFAAAIHRNALRLEQLVEDLMALSRLEQRAEESRFETVSLVQVAEEARELVAHAAATKNIEITISLPSDLPQVKGDPQQLQKVFVNILDNGIKYSVKGSAVVISAQKIGEEVQVQIRDNGLGIAPEDLPRIFERFYRAEKSRSREEGGSGLGLAIAKHIVQTQGGEIWAESELGKGTAFFFTLPLFSQT